MLMVHFTASPRFGKFPKRINLDMLLFSSNRYRLTGSIENLATATKYYSKFLRHLGCGGDLYPGQGGACQFNSTHNGTCSPDCIRGLEDAGEYCGCSGGIGPQCPNSPPHIRC